MCGAPDSASSVEDSKLEPLMCTEQWYADQSGQSSRDGRLFIPETTGETSSADLAPSIILRGEESGRKRYKASDYRDYWHREPGCIVRVHVKPRRALFAPSGTKDGPSLVTLSPGRCTQVVTEKPRRCSVIQDSWTNPLTGRRVLDRRWTGMTIFNL